MKYQLRERLDRLPFNTRNQVRNEAIKKAQVSPRTFTNVLAEKSNNLDLLQALAVVLGCTIDDVLNPEYDFNPELIQAGKEAVK